MLMPSDATDATEQARRTQARQAAGSQGSAYVVNIGRVERAASIALGGVLLLRAIRRPSPRAAAMVVGAGALLQRGVTGHSYVYGALGREPIASRRGPRTISAQGVERSITVAAAPDVLYGAFRDPRQLAAILGHFAAIDARLDGALRWRVGRPGKGFEWTTHVVQDRPGELLMWRTDPGAPVHHEGAVRFRPAPGDWGTIVTLSLRFAEPHGAAGRLAAKFLKRLPRALEASVLRRLKSLSESGEIPSLERNPSARRAQALQTV